MDALRKAVGTWISENYSSDFINKNFLDHGNSKFKIFKGRLLISKNAFKSLKAPWDHNVSLEVPMTNGMNTTFFTFNLDAIDEVDAKFYSIIEYDSELYKNFSVYVSTKNLIKNTKFSDDTLYSNIQSGVYPETDTIKDVKEKLDTFMEKIISNGRNLTD